MGEQRSGRWKWFVPCVVGIGTAGCRPAPQAESARAGPPAAAVESGPRPVRPRLELSASIHAVLGRAPAGFSILRRKGRDVLAFRVSSEEAVRVWESLHAARASTGHYPVIMTEAEDWELPEGDPDVPLSTDPEQWFLRRREWLDQQGEGGRWPIPRGQSGEVAPLSTPVVLHDIVSGAPRQDLVVALFPVGEGSEVAPFLGFGGWNDCPSAEDHALVWRAWQVGNGAELIVLTGDTVEFRVARPPASRAAALALALDQYVYCYDIVDQGTETVDALAAVLEASDFWFFWWD